MTWNLSAGVARLWNLIDHHPHPRRLYFILLTLLLALGFLPLLLPGLPAGHDSGFHLARLHSLVTGLRQGIFPVWINTAALNGFGYGTPLFYSDLCLYPFALLGCLGLPLIWCAKLFLVSCGILAGWSMFLVVYRISGHHAYAAFCGGLLYAWSSYFATDLFARSAFGEAAAFLCLPWILLGFYHLLHGDPRQILPLAGGFAGLVYTHHITLILMILIGALFVALHLAVAARDLRRLFWIAPAAILALLLSAPAWMPMLEQLACIRFNLTAQTMTSPVHERVIPLVRLFLEIPYMRTPHWMPPGIGMIFVVILALRTRMTGDSSQADSFGVSCLLAGLLTLLGATAFLPWEGALRALASIQFPWRLYLPATAFLSVGGALTLKQLTSPARRRFWTLILFCGCASAWWLNAGYVYAAKISEKSMWQTFTAADVTRYAYSGQHYLPQGSTAADYLHRPAICTILNATEPAETSQSVRPDGTLVFRAGHLQAGTVIALPRTPYVGYEAELSADGALPIVLPLDLSQSELRVTIPRDSRQAVLTVRYRQTPLQTTALAAALFSLVGIGFFMGRRYCKRQTNI